MIYVTPGLNISSNLVVTHTHTLSLTLAQKVVIPLFSMIAQFKLPCAKALRLFGSFIRPIALYNSENLAHLTHHQIDALTQNKTSLLSYMMKLYTNKVHLKFLKYILGVKRNCSNMAVLGEIGEFPLHLYGFTSLLSFWHRSTQMPDNSLIKQALNLVYDSFQSEWNATVKYLLSFLNMEEYYRYPCSINNAQFTAICTKKAAKQNF